MTHLLKLPAPQIEIEFPLMKALLLRRTKRKWNHLAISEQERSNLLWAAAGLTQQATTRIKSKRTIPSARNAQVVKVYLADETGFYRYDEELHALFQHGYMDIREHLSTQRMMKSAPLGLIYVADFSRLKGYVGNNDEKKWFVTGTEAGCMIQNVYLYCAAANLNTAVIGLVNREKLEKLMGLPDFEKVVYTQVVGMNNV